MFYRPETQEFFIGHSAVRAGLACILPPSLDDELLAGRGVYPLQRAVQPSVLPDEIAELLEPEEGGGGWTQAWQVRPCTEEELAQRATDLERLKQVKNLQVNRWREEANSTVFSYLGKDISCDELSKMDIMGTAMQVALNGALPADWPGGWKAVDNSIISITTAEEFTPLFSAFTQRGTENFNRSQELKLQLAAATTAEEVDAITW